MQRLIYLFIVGLILGSCEQAINLDLPEYEPKLVIEGIISTGQQVTFDLDRTREYFVYEYEGDLAPDEEITDAQVTFSIGEVDHNFIWAGGLYQWDQFNVIEPEPGKVHKLRVEYEGQIIEATTEIPAPVTFGDLEINTVLSSDFGYYSYEEQRLSVKIQDTPNENNYYRLRYNAVAFEDDLGPIFKGQTIRSDRNQDGQEITLTEEIYVPWQVEVGELDSVIIDILVESISESVYDWETSVEAQDDFSGGPFTEPSPLNGNLDGALGVFGGIGRSERKTFKIPCCE